MVRGKSLIFLNKQRDISKILKRGHRIQSGFLILFYLPQNLSYLRVALAFSAKKAKSVVRNRLKRWSRQILREKLKTAKEPVSVDVVLTIQKKDRDFYKDVKYKDFFFHLEEVFKKSALFNQRGD